MGERRPQTGAIPEGRFRRTAPLAALTARATAAGVVDVLKRRLQGERGASLDFHVRNAERYASFLSQSKGVLMKAGQILSFVDTAGLIPKQHEAVYKMAFSSLQADAEPMDPEVVAAVIESELGRPPEEIFTEFTPTPLAAASIGQVHAARLPDGTEVAVKVQYPGVAAAIRSDLDNTELVATFVKIAKGLVPGLTNVDPRAVADEVAARIGEELDYLTELRNQADFADVYRGHPFIRIPELFPELSSPSVLTMELVKGRRWEQAMEADQDLRNQWGEAIDRFFFGAIYRFRMFNADPHPGNYLFHDDGSVTFLDFGCVKRFTPEALDVFASVARHSVDGDAEGLRTLFIENGFLRAHDAPPADEILEWYRPSFASLVEPQPFTFTPEFAADVVSRIFDPMGPSSAIARRFDIPQDYVFVNRIYIGLFSVLAALGATNDWRAMYEELYSGDPATEYGRLEAEFFGGLPRFSLSTSAE